MNSFCYLYGDDNLYGCVWLIIAGNKHISQFERGVQHRKFTEKYFQEQESHKGLCQRKTT